MEKKSVLFDFSSHVGKLTIRHEDSISSLNAFAESNRSKIVWLHSAHAALIESSIPLLINAAPMFQQFEERGCDIHILETPLKPKKLFLADMDSTMIEQECIDELADKVGLKEQVSHITERAMRGEIAFEPALRERVALLKGLPITVVDELIAEKITLTSGGGVAIATMKAHGTYTCLVSGGFTVFTSRIASMLGFDEHRANELVVRDGLLTGEVREPILGKEAKRTTLIELRDKLGLEAQETLAIGDGANDLDMLQEAGLGVAFRAKPAVASAAHTRITHGDLTALLYLQGYNHERWQLP
jgi:phosphoserine phosphatase